MQTITVILTIQSKQNKKLETKNFLIVEKSYKDLVIYFTRYVHSRSIKMLSLHYHELMRKKEKKLMVDDCYMLDKLLDKVKQIVSTEKFDNTKILTDTDNKLLDDITSKNEVILATCVLKGNGIFHPQILEEALLVT